MHIDNGIGVDAGWTKQIAHSPDGVIWTPLNKANLTVKPAVTKGNPNSPLVDSNDSYVICITYKEETMLKFNLNEVKNQAGWTLNNAGILQAVDDISTWISL